MLQQSVIEWRDGWFEEGLQKGRQEGLQEGRQEGRQEGEATVLLRLLEKKFGSVPKKIRSRVESANARELLEWADRILTAETIEQVFEG